MDAARQLAATKGGGEGRRDRANENAPPRKILKIF
jgi:hypothetical protein